MDSDWQKLVLGAYMLHLMTETNGGKEPRTFWQMRRAGRRFGYDIRFLPYGVPETFLRRGPYAAEGGVIYIRRTRNIAQMRVEILHELAEAAGRYEGVSPCVCQITRHEAACAAVELKFGRLA